MNTPISTAMAVLVYLFMRASISRSRLASFDFDFLVVDKLNPPVGFALGAIGQAQPRIGQILESQPCIRIAR